MKSRFHILSFPVTWLIAVTCFLVFTEQAAAQSNLCRRLEAQLASLGSGSGGSASSAAVRRQQGELQKANRIARARGCFNSQARLGSGGRCARHLNLIRRMERNLVRLQRAAQRGGGTRNARTRARILRQLARNNCRGNLRELRTDRNSSRRSLVEQVFGRETVQENDPRRRSSASRRAIPRGGTFRTMCVRTCDGYYFPISFSTTRGYFDGDEQACSRRCPGAETRLYYHPIPSGVSEDMVSYPGGEAYVEQPFAFAYRKEKVKSCSCGAPSQNRLQVLAGQGSLTNLTGDNPDRIHDYPDGIKPADQTPYTFAVPNWRPVRGLDPESRANRLGDFTLSDMKQLLQTPQDKTRVAGSNKSQEKSIRLVGPRFFPAQ